MISVRSEVQILPGPPPTFAPAKCRARQRCTCTARAQRERCKASFVAGRGSGCGATARAAQMQEEAPCAGWRLPRLLSQPLTPLRIFVRATPAQKTRGCSSVGRAPALQAGGRRFDSDHLHHGASEARLPVRQRCACTARAPTGRRGAAFMSRRGAREIDRGKKVCAGASALARVIFDRVKRE